MVRSEHAPVHIEPHRGQVSENGSKSPANESWAVLHEDESRCHLANDPRHLPPESAPGPVDSSALSGDADVLTGKPSRNHVNTASPWASVEGANVIPDRERGEASVVLPGDQYVPCVGVVLDGADGAPSEEVPPEYASTSARE